MDGLKNHIATKADIRRLDQKLIVLGSKITILKWGIHLIIALNAISMIKQFIA